MILLKVLLAVIVGTLICVIIKQIDLTLYEKEEENNG